MPDSIAMNSFLSCVQTYIASKERVLKWFLAVMLVLIGSHLHFGCSRTLEPGSKPVIEHRKGLCSLPASQYLYQK